jgi:nucleoid-associated protein YgaU
MKNRLFKWTLTASVFIFLGTTNTLFATESSSKLELTEAPKDIIWVNIVVASSETTLADLASTYYGDVKEASLIYESNKDVIPKSKKLMKGMKLKMPVTDKFIDQPEHLGWH